MSILPVQKVVRNSSLEREFVKHVSNRRAYEILTPISQYSINTKPSMHRGGENVKYVTTALVDKAGDGTAPDEMIHKVYVFIEHNSVPWLTYVFFRALSIDSSCLRGDEHVDMAVSLIKWVVVGRR